MILDHFHALVDELVFSTLLILATVFIHAAVLHGVIQTVGHFAPRARSSGHGRFFWKTGLMMFAVIGIFFSHTLQIWLWAAFYLLAGVPPITSLEEAVYFSAVTYSTLGYGDIVLAPFWRVMSGIEAANGMVVFGWSIAVLFEITALLYTRLDIRQFRPRD